MEKIIIGTRGSTLALAQTDQVIHCIQKKFPHVHCEKKIITTKGDKLWDRPLAEFGGKGAFVTEFEEGIKNGKIDIAVHSAKDMPIELAEGLDIIGVLKRENPKDVLVTNSLQDFMEKEHPVIGTSSLRRQFQVLNIFPNASCQVLRGNVNTRLMKLQEGMYDGIILAAAGLNRLGLEKEEKFQYKEFETDIMIPAAGQGIIAIEGKKRSRFSELFAAVSDKKAKLELMLERKALSLMGAGCHEPVGVFTQVNLGEEKVSIWMLRAYNGQIKKEVTTVSLEKAQEAIEKMALKLEK